MTATQMPEPTAAASPTSGMPAAPRPAPVVLASRSPRRRQLLSEFGVEHRCAEPLFDDAQLASGRVPACWWVASLAYLKAWASRARELASPGGIPPGVVIGADTACIKGGKLIGTPRDAGEAEAIIRFLANGTHRVVTGVALLWSDGRRELFAVDAQVQVGPLSDSQIAAYIESGLWEGKAGAYNLRERIDAGWPITFKGDPTAIMGLPMDRLLPLLRGAGLAPLGTATQEPRP